ncbi:hypothetical protein Tco_0892578 [Tanacetum coccineum]|uniref:Uncharacterized protein n=1 Tax=Tanacetum coccineum TaxID=301880 RepID=A0ABQ5C6A3_9ASTR
MVAPPTTTAPPSLLLEVVTVSTPISGVPVARAPMYGADGWENVEAPVRATDLLQMDGKRIKRASSLAVRTNAVQNGIARKMIGLFY